MLTTCPGCLQGLSRYEERADMDAEYIVVEMARQILGANWRDQFIRTVKNGGIESIETCEHPARVEDIAW